MYLSFVYLVIFFKRFVLTKIWKEQEVCLPGDRYLVTMENNCHQNNNALLWKIKTYKID